MKYGHFDAAAGEYVITRPDTPLPWSNYLGDAGFGAIVTNHAGGYTFIRSAAQGCLTRYRFNNASTMNPGKFVYVRDRDTAAHWTPAWQPAPPPADDFHYTCRFGTGYAVIAGAYDGIACETTYTIPLDALHEAWRIAVTNTSGRPRHVSVFPFIEPQCNWNNRDDAFNMQYTQSIVRVAEVDGMLDIGHNVNMPVKPEPLQNKLHGRYRFFALAGARAAAYEGDLRAFLGPYGTYARPDAVLRGACSNSLAVGDNPAAAYQVDLDLAPGERREFVVLFGVGRADEEGRATRAAFGVPGAFDAALAAVRDHWRARLRAFAVESPDADFDALANLWAPYNNLICFHWSRAASLVYAGERDGLGFRDSVQDVMGAAALIPDDCRDRLELLLTGQLAHGGCMPVVKPFAHRPGHETAPPLDMLRSDDALWLFNAVPEYVKETGDIGLYRRVLPFADAGEATVLGHLRRAIEFNLRHSGAHGLPCGLKADWNDCLRLGAAGETAFVAFQLRLALAEYVDIAERLSEASEAAWAREALARFDRILAEHVWDGEWYVRGMDADGMKFGSRECTEGRIYVNPQSWAVLSGHADAERGRAAMDAVGVHLATDHGIVLCAPPYRTTKASAVLALLYNPGMKENAAIFNHVQGWAVMAEVALGRADRAWAYLRAALPSSYNDRAEVRQVEPYVVCQSTHGPASARSGAGRLPWLSGSATWNYYAITHAILGVYPHYDGLEIRPAMPPEWKAYTMTRRFRGKAFTIRVRRAKADETPSLTLNGETVEGALLPTHRFRAENTVDCVIPSV